MTHEDAVKDFTMYLEDMVLKRPLTYEEARALKIKVEHWWGVAREEEHIASGNGIIPGW